MKKQEEINSELKASNWPPYTKETFVDEVLLNPVLEQIGNDEKVISQIWGVRLNEKGEQTTEYELLTLTKTHLVSAYSDMENDQDKVKVLAQDLKNIHKFTAQPSNLHKGYLRVNIIFKGSAWILETKDFETTEHFNRELDQLLINARHENDEDAYTNLVNDDKSNRSLRTVHADFLEKQPKTKHHKSSRSSQHKKNFDKIKKYARNNILWYSLALISSFSIFIIAAVYVGIFDDYGSANAASKNIGFYYLVTGGVFTIIFAVINFVSFLMLTMKVWDKEKFSRNLYRVLAELVLSLILIISGIVMLSKIGPQGFEETPPGYTVALLSLPAAIWLWFDSSYMIAKARHDLRHAK